jgi:hypothetical protein
MSGVLGPDKVLGFYGSGGIVKPTGNALTALTNFGLINSPTLAESDITNLITDLSAKAPLASPDFTETLTADTSTLVVDGIYHRVGVLTAAPAVEFDVQGNSIRLHSSADPSYYFQISNNYNNTDTVDFFQGTNKFLMYGLDTNSLVLQPISGNVGIGIIAPGAVLPIKASTTAAASLRVRSGTAPTSPNDGDIWYEGTNIKMQVGGATKTFTLT